jgi:hypothetical protein
MTQFNGKLLPETLDQFRNESNHQPRSTTEGFEPVHTTEEEHNLEGEWIDIGGEG